jgi:hypothetical protein
VGTMVVLLTGRAPVTVSRVRTPMPAKAPAWTTQLPKSGDGMFAVGTARTEYDAHKAWTEAERQARRGLAFAAKTSIRSATDVRTGVSSNAAIIASTAADIRNIEIRERWADKHAVYVLVHARVTPLQDSQ